MEGFVISANSGDERMEEKSCDLILKLFDKKQNLEGSCPEELVAIEGLIDALFMAFKFDYAKRAVWALMGLANSKEDLAIISKLEDLIQRLSQSSISNDPEEQHHLLILLGKIKPTRPNIILEQGFIRLLA